MLMLFYLISTTGHLSQPFSENVRVYLERMRIDQ